MPEQYNSAGDHCASMAVWYIVALKASYCGHHCNLGLTCAVFFCSASASSFCAVRSYFGCNKRSFYLMSFHHFPLTSDINKAFLSTQLKLTGGFLFFGAPL
ncbi:hypothetical protein AMECASPLE_014802 [Ameca splendens]|uniref:Uncharacterized protein n=1 Tax=Ameca splendens TaxID=208324 RepID=A0ABV1A827_9TELE